MKLRYKDFQVYKDSKSLVVLIFRLTRKFPKEFYYLSDQIISGVIKQLGGFSKFLIKN